MMDSHKKGLPPVDIIIPVYNALDDLKLCIASVKKYTDLAQNRLILVNDCSPDAAVTPYLDSLVQSGILVLQNAENLGFSGSVNRGIACSDTADVLLLNSDTVVTQNWLQKIGRCAQNDSAIGTVTPLSNSATLCSVPNFCMDNPLPAGFTADSYGDLIERISLKRYPRISVAVGFCMYIKRCVIHDIGLFDAATFERGYGEENDFCNRLEQLGYYNAMCDDTFIYHRGTASFVSENKAELCRRHEEILRTWYPDQMHANDIFCRDNPVRDIQENVRLHLAMANGKQNILFLAQRDFAPDAFDHVGGTQMHTKDLTFGLCNQYNVFVLARDKSVLRLTVYVGTEKFYFRFFIGEAPIFDCSTDAVQKKVYETVLDGFDIDIVHIQHTYELSLDLFYEAKKRNIPLYCTLHDFYTICPTIMMLNAQDTLCLAQRAPEQCAACLRKRTKISDRVDYIAHWRAVHRKALQQCNQLFAPRESAKNVVLSYYPELAERLTVIAHGIQPFAQESIDTQPVVQTTHIQAMLETLLPDGTVNGWAFLKDGDGKNDQIWIGICADGVAEERFHASIVERKDVAAAFENETADVGFHLQLPADLTLQNPKIQLYIEREGTLFTDGKQVACPMQSHRLPGNFNVAFIGGLSTAKGSDMAYEMITSAATRKINWFVIGGIGDERLARLQQKNYVKTGWYQRDDLPLVLKRHKIDLVCIFSICSETFGYTLAEAAACGVPVVVTDAGALKERTQAMQCGWVLPQGAKAEQAIQVIENLHAHPEKLQKTVAHLQNLQQKDIAQMVADYTKWYAKNQKHRAFAAADYAFLYQAYQTKEKMENQNIDDASTEKIREELARAKTQLQEWHDSKTYRILQWVDRVKAALARIFKK